MGATRSQSGSAETTHVEAVSVPRRVSLVTAPPRQSPNKGPGPVSLRGLAAQVGKSQEEALTRPQSGSTGEVGVKGIKVKYNVSSSDTCCKLTRRFRRHLGWRGLSSRGSVALRRPSRVPAVGRLVDRSTEGDGWGSRGHRGRTRPDSGPQGPCGY